MLQDEHHLTNIQHVQDSITPIQESVLRSNLNLWFNRGLAQLEGSKISFKKLYNLRGSAGESRNSLLKIINYNLSAFTDIYPLILANPTTVSTLFPMQSNIFDLVIFDEASQLRIEDTFSSLYRGKSAIISGDSQQMPPSSYFESNKTTIDTVDDSELDTDLEERMLEESEIEMASKESLLEWAIQEGYTETYLDMHYRSKHPDLIEFSNVCFYNSRLIPMPGSISEAPITYVAVNGLYENRTNHDEATKVVQILKNDIPYDKSVGVATFNLTQRNLILDLIAKERFADRSFNDKMTLLDQNGFFVKNLENVQGDERDIIIISTTFGVKSNGAFTMMFGPIGQKNGYRLLNVIITRAKEKLFVLTSIPEVKQHEYRNFILNEAKVSGKSGLLAYLLYCKHVSEGNNKAKEELSYIMLAKDVTPELKKEAITSYQKILMKSWGQ
jgi:superfamily I DNA and/or RNA helicase